MEKDYSKVTGTVFNVQRLSVNDGPGIRTIVFLKGCPLDCLWCHNPESKSAEPQLFLTSRRCIGCGYCAQVCPNQVHSFTAEGQHIIERDKCTLCGACVKECIGALEICGKIREAGDVIEEVKRDELFYRNSGGGMTLSGGEPFFQFDFAEALLVLAKENNLHTCVETCGFVNSSELKRVAHLVDEFLYDVKECDPVKHEQYTGVTNELIRENMKMLDECGGRIVLRCPIIPGYNDREEHLIGIAELANSLKNAVRIEISPYHPLGESKSEAIGEEYPLKGLTFPTEETVQSWIDTIAAHTSLVVKKT